MNDEDIYDIGIVGAGPVGLAAAVDAKQMGLKVIVLEKGVITNSVFNFPVFMRFFTTAKELEIGNHPFPSTATKPTRQQALDYYRGVLHNENLNVKLYHTVEEITGEKGNFVIEGMFIDKGEEFPYQHKAKYIIIATGYFDNPKGLGGIPGEDNFNTSYYYSGDPHEFYNQDVAIIGAGNSGAEAALELFRHGARVHLIHKYAEPSENIKYWVRTDLLNRIKEGSIDIYMPAETKEITAEGVLVEMDNEEYIIEADFVFILTGFLPDIDNLRKWGLELNDDLSVKLSTNYESQTRRGLYVIGSAGAGLATNKVFIENGRNHAKKAVKHIKTKIEKTNR